MIRKIKTQISREELTDLYLSKLICYTFTGPLPNQRFYKVLNCVYIVKVIDCVYRYLYVYIKRLIRLGNSIHQFKRLTII